MEGGDERLLVDLGEAAELLGEGKNLGGAKGTAEEEKHNMLRKRGGGQRC